MDAHIFFKFIHVYLEQKYIANCLCTEGVKRKESQKQHGNCKQFCNVHMLLFVGEYFNSALDD